MATLTFNNSTTGSPETLEVLETVQEVIDIFNQNPAATFIRLQTETDIFQWINKNTIQKIS